MTASTPVMLLDQGELGVQALQVRLQDDDVDALVGERVDLGLGDRRRASGSTSTAPGEEMLASRAWSGR
jgi:hypothetical protein